MPGAVSLGGSGVYYRRSTNIGTVGIANWSACAWINITTKSDFAGVLSVTHSSNGRWNGLGFNNAVPQLLQVRDHAGSTPFASTPATGVWVFVAFSSGAASGTLSGYWKLPTDTSFTTQTRVNGVEASVQGEAALIGLIDLSSPTATLNGRVAAVKFWDNAVLTSDEFWQESGQYMPARLANLYAWYPLLSTDDDEIDFSGLG